MCQRSGPQPCITLLRGSKGGSSGERASADPAAKRLLGGIAKQSRAKTTMIRIELVEDGLPTAVLYDYVDAIEEAMLREREAFEWALAREAMSPFSGFQSQLMERLRRVVERRPKLCAALAVAGAAGLGYWLWSSSSAPAEDEVPENARCPICMDQRGNRSQVDGVEE